VVEVTKVSTVTKSQLGAYIGRLSAKRIEQIRAGMRLVQASYWESR
jgi:mRNA-degrading endonuclease toxin of MazEF toxin-antitoxin module